MVIRLIFCWIFCSCEKLLANLNLISWKETQKVFFRGTDSSKLMPMLHGNLRQPILRTPILHLVVVQWDVGHWAIINEECHGHLNSENCPPPKKKSGFIFCVQKKTWVSKPVVLLKFIIIFFFSSIECFLNFKVTLGSDLWYPSPSREVCWKWVTGRSGDPYLV